MKSIQQFIIESQNVSNLAKTLIGKKVDEIIDVLGNDWKLVNQNTPKGSNKGDYCYRNEKLKETISASAKDGIITFAERGWK